MYIQNVIWMQQTVFLFPLHSLMMTSKFSDRGLVASSYKKITKIDIFLHLDFAWKFYVKQDNGQLFNDREGNNCDTVSLLKPIK